MLYDIPCHSSTAALGMDGDYLDGVAFFGTSTDVEAFMILADAKSICI